MKKAGDSTSRSLGMCGMEIRRTLKEYYLTPEAAEKAIRKAMEDVEALESWATIVTANEERVSIASEIMTVDSGGHPFRFSDVPAPIRDTAIQSMAAAMLAWNVKQERSVA